MNIPVSIDFPDEHLWSAICGSAWETWRWWYGWDYYGGSWEHPCELWIMVENPFDDYADDEPDYLTAVVTIADLKRAISELSDHPPVMEALVNDLDFDAVYGDAVMQQAIFGEIIFG